MEIRKGMKKITDMLIDEKDPTNEYGGQLVELLHEVKIKLIKYEDNEEISTNLFNMLKIFFNDVIIKDLIESIYPEQKVKQLMRQHVIDEILKKK
jgi:hypothetical protein